MHIIHFQYHFYIDTKYIIYVDITYIICIINIYYKHLLLILGYSDFTF